MAEPTFSDVVDWLTHREGKSVYVEIGMTDPTLDNADFYPLAMHAKLEKPQMGEDTGHDGRGLVFVRFSGGERNRLYIDKRRVTKIQTRPGAMKLTFHDTIYLHMSG